MSFWLHAGNAFWGQVGVKKAADNVHIMLDSFFAFETCFYFIMGQPEVGVDIDLRDEVFPDLLGQVVAEDAEVAVSFEHVAELYFALGVHVVVAGFDFRYFLDDGDEMEENEAVVVGDIEKNFGVVEEVAEAGGGDVFGLCHRFIHGAGELVKERENNFLCVFVVVLEVAVTDVYFFGDVADSDRVGALFVI